MTKMMRTFAPLALGGLCLLHGVALAESGAANAHADYLQKGPPRPPAEAFTACQSKGEGDACEVTFRERIIEGTCVAPKQEELFCMPNDMPPPPPHGEPPPAR